MSNGTAAAIIIGVLVVVAVVGFRPQPTTVETLPAGASRQHAQPGEARVRGGSQSSGISVLGITLQSPTLSLRVELFAAPGCFDAIDIGDPWPAPHPQCESPVPVAGRVSGVSLAPTGETTVVVEFEVARDCFEIVGGGGGPWPTGHPECEPAERDGSR